MNIDPCIQFEQDLKKVIRRASRSSEFEPQIKEFSSHFADLFEDERAKGLDEFDANRAARQRLGSLYSIAFQIVQTPKRSRTGVRLQLVCFCSYVLLIGAYLSFTLYTDNPQWVQWLAALAGILIAAFIGVGLLLGYGVLLARRFLWKPMALAGVVAFVGGGFTISILARPERLFHMTQQEARLLVVQQERVGRQAAAVEAIMSTILAKPGNEESAMKVLPTRIASTHVRLFELSTEVAGQYAYPAAINFVNDPLNSYRIQFKRTNDASLAKAQWQSRGSEIAIAMRIRHENLDAYRGFSTMNLPDWKLGFPASGELALASLAAFLMLAAVGYMLGGIRILGRDFFRLSRN